MEKLTPPNSSGSSSSIVDGNGIDHKPDGITAADVHDCSQRNGKWKLKTIYAKPYNVLAEIDLARWASSSSSRWPLQRSGAISSALTARLQPHTLITIAIGHSLPVSRLVARSASPPLLQIDLFCSSVLNGFYSDALWSL